MKESRRKMNDMHDTHEHGNNDTPCSKIYHEMTKRSFIKGLLSLVILATATLSGRFLNIIPKSQFGNGNAHVADSPLQAVARTNKHISNLNLSAEANGRSIVYYASGNSPEKNMGRIIDELGGINSIIAKEDIVILKPNAQWWAQGMTNTNAMKAFMEKVLAIPGFEGEIIIADNHQYASPNSRGWTTDQPNGDFNYNTLISYFNQNGHKNVSKYHWRGAGPNPNPIEGDDELGSKIVSGPEEGDGYVWSDTIIYESPLRRRCLMTWPIFTSTYSGVTIDFKGGAWKDGRYTGQPVKFINFSSINHHTKYGGVTASVKNYMGIVDMSCGFQGSTPKYLFNTHFIGLRTQSVPFLEKIRPYRVRKKVKDWLWNYNHKHFHHTGGALGTFMREVRMADMNFITANWIGWGSRTNKEQSGYPKALFASIDPVALDYVACQEALYPLTLEKTDRDQFIQLNNASIKDGPFHRFLLECHKEGIGNIDPHKHDVIKL